MRLFTFLQHEEDITLRRIHTALSVFRNMSESLKNEKRRRRKIEKMKRRKNQE